jgi:hypothetical protein
MPIKNFGHPLKSEIQENSNSYLNSKADQIFTSHDLRLIPTGDTIPKN